MRVKTDYIDYDKVDEKTRASMDRLFSAPRRGYWARKRAFDIIVSLIMLLLLVPLFIVVSIVIVIDDPHAGPFFKQQRVGRHGVEFSMYKFRTMVANAEQLKDRLRGQVFETNEHRRAAAVDQCAARRYEPCRAPSAAAG